MTVYGYLQAKFNKKYNNDIEEQFRMTTFIENKFMIEEHNLKYKNGLVSFSQAINKFSDMLRSEFIARHSGFENYR